MKTVILHGRKAAGRVALVDDEDYEFVMQYRWAAWESPAGGLHPTTNLPGRGRGTRAVLMHQLLTSYPLTDHRDCDGLNNQRSNLRASTTGQNMANRRKRRGSRSPYKGVTWDGQHRKWRVRVKMNGNVRDLGVFTDETEAALAYDATAREMHGEFARLNFPCPGEASALEVVTLAADPAGRNGVANPERAGSSKYMGVFWDKQRRKWHVVIHAGGKQAHVGYFVSEIEAAIAWDDAARKVYGERAWLNFPDDVSAEERDRLRRESAVIEAAAKDSGRSVRAAGARDYWARREPVSRTCADCGREYLTKRPTQSEFCSNTCAARTRRRRDRKSRLAS